MPLLGVTGNVEKRRLVGRGPIVLLYNIVHVNCVKPAVLCIPDSAPLFVGGRLN